MRIMQTPDTPDPVAWAKIVSFERGGLATDEEEAKFRAEETNLTREGEATFQVVRPEGGLEFEAELWSL